MIGVHFQKKNQVIGTYPLNALNVCVQVCDLVAAPARLASALDAKCPKLNLTPKLYTFKLPCSALSCSTQTCDLTAAPARLASALDASCPNLRTLEILELPTAPDHKVVSHFQQLLALRRQEAGEVEKVFVSYCDE